MSHENTVARSLTKGFSVKVLKEKPFSLKRTCKCGSVLYIEEGDVKYGDFGRWNDTVFEFYATCPVCERDIILEPEQIPPKVEQIVRARRGN